MVTNLMAQAARAARTIGALAAALTLAIVLTNSAGAERNSVLEARANAAVAHCLQLGGIITEVNYDLDENLDIVSITIGCWTPSEGFWTCNFDVHPTGPHDGVHCNQYFPNPYPNDPYYPGGGTNAPAPVDDPRTEGDIVIIGTGTYAQDDDQPATGQYGGTLDFGDGGQATTGVYMPVDTVEDEGPTTVEPYGSDVITEDEEVTPFEYRRNRGGDEEQP